MSSLLSAGSPPDANSSLLSPTESISFSSVLPFAPAPVPIGNPLSSLVTIVGDLVGTFDGTSEGTIDGSADGSIEGSADGSDDGCIDGSSVHRMEAFGALLYLEGALLPLEDDDVALGVC